MDEKKMIKIMAALTVVIALGGGIFAYHTHQVNAQEVAQTQTIIAQQDAEKAQETAAQQAKANDPRVDESQPGRYVTKADPATTTPAGTSSAQTQSNASATATTTTTAPQETLKLTTTPPAQPKVEVTQDTVAAITSLSEADIQRLQSYPVDSDGELYVSFNDMDKTESKTLLEKFSPTTLSAYSKAKVGWLSSPKLVYYSSLAQYCVRGILTVTYYGDNSFGLTPNVTYQREVEYKLRNSVTNGNVTLKLESTNYLSGFKAVK